MHLLIPPMSLKYETGHGGKCRDRSSSTADSAARVHTLSVSPSTPNRVSQRSDFCRTAHSTLISTTRHAMRAVLPNLIFIPPAVTLQRRIVIFWFGPWGDFMKVSKRARGCGVGCRWPRNLVTWVAGASCSGSFQLGVLCPVQSWQGGAGTYRDLPTRGALKRAPGRPLKIFRVAV